MANAMRGLTTRVAETKMSKKSRRKKRRESMERGLKNILFQELFSSLSFSVEYRRRRDSTGLSGDALFQEDAIQAFGLPLGPRQPARFLFHVSRGIPTDKTAKTDKTSRS